MTHPSPPRTSWPSGASAPLSSRASAASQRPHEGRASVSRGARLALRLGLCLTLCAGAGAGCKGGPGASEPIGARHAAQRLMPLAEGNVWTYDAYDQDGHGPTIAGIQVTRGTGGEFTVASLFARDSRETYQLRPEGIYLPDSGGWLLREPVTVGARWPSRNGREAQVVDTDVRITTPRGTFEGCVQINEDGGELEIHVETVYCTDIGVVATASSMTSNMTGMTVTQRAELREYVVEPPATE